MLYDGVEEANIIANYIWIPSRDGRVDVNTMQVVLAAMKPFQPAIIVTQASNIPRGRNECFRVVREMEPGVQEVFGLWLDDDMVFRFPGDIDYLNTMVMYAYDLHTRVAANYRIAGEGFRTQVMQHRHHKMTNELFVPDADGKRFHNLGDQGCSGFGVLAGWFRPDYQFHADEFGEDVYYWLDHPQSELVIDAGWMPGHRKAVVL